MLTTLAAGLTVLTLVLAAAIVSIGGHPAAGHGDPCVASLAAAPLPPGQAARLGPQQRQVAGAIIAGGKHQHLPARAWQIALQAGDTESGLKQLPGGDRDSVGVFQIRGNHGSLAQRSNLQWQVDWFYTTLQGVPGWDSLQPGAAAQQVERSAFPGRYQQAGPLAAALVRDLGGATDPSGCHQTPPHPPGSNPDADRALAAARSTLGAPYIWGATGPNAFDCSGLVQWSYQQAGLTVPANTRSQYPAGRHLPIQQAQPGDLVFWADASGNPAAIHHVGLYLGHGQVLHAPQPGEGVTIRPLWHTGLVPTVTRPAPAT